MRSATVSPARGMDCAGQLRRELARPEGDPLSAQKSDSGCPLSALLANHTEEDTMTTETETTGIWRVTFTTGDPSEVSATSAGISSAGVLVFQDQAGDLIRAFAAGEWTRVERLKTAAVDLRHGRR